MRHCLIAIFLLFTSMSNGQDDVNIYMERSDTEVTIYADNPHVIPMTIDLTLNLTNMKTDFGGNKGLFVIPEKSNGFQIATAKAITKYSRSGLSLESYVYTGDTNK